MTAIALIGGDGSGKTTIAHHLVDSLPVRAHYLYMGLNPDSSNVALPTTRLVHALKVRRAVADSAGSLSAEEARSSLHRLENRSRSRSRLWTWARLANRLAEELIRQAVSWGYQMQGIVVVYDRHFLFDHGGPADSTVPERIHRWFLRHLYPKPNLAILLDAPGAVLWPRTREVPAEFLDGLHETYRRLGDLVPDFRVISVDRDIAEVESEVSRVVVEFLDQRRFLARPSRQRRDRRPR